MSADFWAGYISGAAGIVIGNPFDVIKVRLQAARAPPPSRPLLPPSASASALPSHPLSGIAAPVLGYGALNALLFVTYNRAEAQLLSSLGAGGEAAPTAPARQLATFAAGALAGLATWAVSAPTELVKCRAQLGAPSHRSRAVAAHVLRAHGLRGLYRGGAVTALRDSVGYGFYFWSYALLSSSSSGGRSSGAGAGAGALAEAARVLVAGGLSGIATWLSIYPLDVIKTRVQAHAGDGGGGAGGPGAWEVYKQIRREEGVGALFRGLPICCLRAFVVNAVQWGVYEAVMWQLRQGRWAQLDDKAVA